ncbi:oligosaccharide flippase family protein [Myroides odoratimimus]|uniref:oligosaccharide flippase family protein n=1 Tax=Myroides odoratimimus TaxID=76832 RepID=UPI002576B3F4|nr:oligosaccharide flippase family protein [Myroides odoratimimus]MDM1457285.1 oligosaccharide flippase family protein [Myroides odoratimimus]
MSLINKIKQKFSSKDAKVLLENFISLSALQVIGMALPFITLPYVLKVFGYDKYGLIVFANSLVVYFTSLTDYSFRITAVREVAVSRDDKEELDRIYSKVLIVKGLFLIISLLILVLVILLYKPFYEELTVYLGSALMLVGYALFPEWFFQGIEKMRYITYLNLGIKLFFTLCVFVFIREEGDYWLYPLLQSAGFIGAGLIGQWMLMSKYKLKFKWLSIEEIKMVIVNNFPIFVNQFVPTLFNNTTVFFMGFLIPKTAIGVFDIIKKIVNIKWVLIGIVSKVFYPFLSRNKDKFNVYAKYNLLGFSAVFVGMLIIYPVFEYVFDISDGGFLIYVIMCIGLFFVGMESIYGLNYLFVHSHDKVALKITIISSLIGFALAYPLIKFYGIVGGAVNVALSQTIMGVLSYCYYLKLSKKSNYVKDVEKY